MADEEMPAEVALLARDVGTWDAEITIHPGGGAPPIASRGVMTQSLLGGRWLVADFKNETGFEGHGVYGWDPQLGKYVSTWIDSARSFLVLATGDYDAGRRVLTLHSAASIGGRDVRWREETERPSDDERVFRQYFPGPDGGDVLTMTATYTRKLK